MFCPRCGQRQSSNEARYCAACGFPLGVVAELLTNGSQPAWHPPHATAAGQPTPRSRGIKQGAFMMLSTLVVMPIVIFLGVSLVGMPGELIPLAGAVCVLGGLLRMLYAIFFESDAPAGAQGVPAQQYVPPAVAPNYLGTPNSRPCSLPAATRRSTAGRSASTRASWSSRPGRASPSTPRACSKSSRMSRRDDNDSFAPAAWRAEPGTDAPAADERTLAVRLRERIRVGGPLTFREWMGAALYDERGGYYQRRGAERWGRAGDYRTSPERSALFAATFARHFDKLFEELGRPAVLHLVEAGSGSGRFAHGLLSTLRRDAPQLFNSLRYVFDEASADSRRRAAALLAPFAGRVEFRPITSFERPLDAAVIFSNELLDALPVHRVLVRGGLLREAYVGVDERSGDFVFVEGEPSTPRLAEHFRRLGVTLAEGQWAEVNLAAGEWVRRAAGILGRGFVITVDYGDEAAGLYGAPHRRAGTLRAFRRHGLVEDVLRDPGGQDLTTTVDWTQVRAEGEAAGLKTLSLERLDAFLLRAGLLEQLELESAHASSEAEVAALRVDAREMVLPGGMAAHFQVLVQKRSKGRLFPPAFSC